MHRLLTPALALLLAACAPARPIDSPLNWDPDTNGLRQRARELKAAYLDCYDHHRGDLQIGMSAEQVLATCWKRPEYANRTQTGAHLHEQWVYEWSGLLRVYVYLTDGAVTAVQD